MTDFGYTTLDIIPSLKGASGIISKELSASSKTAGVSAGKQLGTSMTRTAAESTKKSSIFTNIEKGAAVSGVGAGRRFGTALHETLGEYTKQIGSMAAGFFAFEAAKEFWHGMIEEGEEAEKVTRLTEQTIASTGGAAGVTAKQVGDLATAISEKVGVDDEAIQSGQNLLLTFKNIRDEAGAGNDIFDQATQSFVDMAAAMAAANDGAVDYRSSVTLIGKALNDPIKGLTALSRVGVTFTSEQQAQIKTLATSGRTMEAQKLILKELKSEFGGAAEALVTPAEKAKVAWFNFEETLGTKVLPTVDKAAELSATSLNGIVAGASAIPGPVKAGAAAWLAYSAAQKLGVGSSATSIARAGLGRVKAGITEVRLQAMIAAEAYRTAAASEAAMASGAARATGSLLALKAATTEVGNASVTGLTKGLSGAMGLIGGPWGAAVLGGTIAVTKLWQAHQEAKQHVADLTASLDAETGAITKNTAATVADALQKNGAADAAKKLGVSLSDLEAAALGNGEAFARVKTQLEASGEAGSFAALKIVAGLSDESTALGKSKKDWADKKELTEGATKATKVATAATRQNTAAAKANSAAMKANNKAAATSITQFRDVAGAAKAAKGSLSAFAADLRKQAKAMNDFGDNAYRASQRGVKEGLIKQLAKLGPQGAQILSKLAHGSKKDIDSMNADFTRWWKSGKNASGKLSAALGGVTNPHWNAQLGIQGVPQALTAVQRLKRQLDGLHDKSLTVTVLTNNAHANQQQKERRATGGRVTAGHLYRVGEFGPEDFMPSVNGSITPNDKLDYGIKPRAAAPAAAAPSVSLAHSSELSGPVQLVLGDDVTSYFDALIDDRIDAGSERDVPTLSIPMWSYQVGSAKRNLKYGTLATSSIQTGTWDLMLACSVAKIPRGATVTSAHLKIWQYGAFTGTSTCSLYANTGAWTSSVTWATLPTRTASSVASLTKTTPGAGIMWSFDVGTTVQSWVSGETVNWGFLMASSTSVLVHFRGATAATYPPVLEVVYTLAPLAPTGLSPSSGAVSDAKPILTFDADDSIVEANVQIADDPLSTADFDGSLSVVAGLFPLADTSYDGLDDGDSKVWRVRQRTAGGWSDWSSWASLARDAMPTLSITSPASSTITDGTPPVEWALASGTQVAWQARLVDAKGNVLFDSGRTPGDATAWTPSASLFRQGLTKDGDSGTVQVWVWDDVDRSAGPGAPVSMYAELDVTLELSADVSPVDTLVITANPPTPMLTLTGTRSEGAPDEVAVFRDGVQVLRLTGTDVFDGTSYSIEDATAPMLRESTYRVAPVTDGAIASGGPEVTVTPSCSGIWLIDADDTTIRACIATGDEQEQATPEQAIEHVPISAGGVPTQVIRRRMVRLPAQGSVSGLLVDAFGDEILADDSEDALEQFAANDAGHLYRLVLGRKNHLVIIGNVDCDEMSTDMDGQRVVGASFDWWARA